MAHMLGRVAPNSALSVQQAASSPAPLSGVNWARDVAPGTWGMGLK